MADSDHVNALAARLHSRYQPQAEADRYMGALAIRPDAEYFIFIEPGLGYLIQALKRLRPESKAVVLHVGSGFREAQCLCPDVPAWYPDSGIGVQEFLGGEIPDTATVQIIEWKPSVGVFGDSCLRLARESAEFAKRAAASRRTGAAFGRRWLRNFFRNMELLREAVLYKAMNAPVVITGSGPGLEAALPQILLRREGLFVMAASSSVPALAAGGIVPDMVVSTDGGGWALLHLHACFRRQDLPRPALLALGLTAAIPSQCSAVPILPISDGSLWQSIALNAAGIPSALVPQRGTVTATALELAMALSDGGIFLAGMDLSLSDIRSHARPYGFDHIFFGSASRFRPVYSQYFARSSDIRAGGSHEVYAAWFNSRLSAWPRRIYSLGGNHVVFEKGLPTKPLEAGGRSGGGVFKAVAVQSPPQSRRRLAFEALAAALGEERYSATLAGELAPLLFPAQKQASAAEITEALRDIAARYGGLAGG
ncbi:MAG: DUF115 domain-containing protein [Treponema sp.]|jgi:hypothetical protein|nr:DUF115 domain-containing protein [Treponema sp.]